MSSSDCKVVEALVAVQAELRRLPRAEESRTAASLARWAGKIFGCRLLHWNPELEHVRVDAIADAEDIEAAAVERVPLWNDRCSDHDGSMSSGTCMVAPTDLRSSLSGPATSRLPLADPLLV